MRLSSVLFKTRGLAIVVAITAVLLGGMILLLRELTPVRTFLPRRVNTGSVIMEGVDINWNRPGDFTRLRYAGDKPLVPPDLQRGVAP